MEKKAILLNETGELTYEMVARKAKALSAKHGRPYFVYFAKARNVWDIDTADPTGRCYAQSVSRVFEQAAPSS